MQQGEKVGIRAELTELIQSSKTKSVLSIALIKLIQSTRPKSIDSLFWTPPLQMPISLYFYIEQSCQIIDRDMSTQPIKPSQVHYYFSRERETIILRFLKARKKDSLLAAFLLEVSYNIFGEYFCVVILQCWNKQKN